MMRVAIVGTGYVGLVSGVCLAAKGHNVVCVDINSEIVDSLNAGKPHIYEEGLPEILNEVRAAGRFVATTDLTSALDQVEIVIIAVGTPSEDGVIDLMFVQEVSRSIGKYLKENDKHISVVIKSTVVPGTTDTLVRAEIEKSSNKKFPAFGLGMNPEFLREGEAISDFMDPDRIVLGYDDIRTLELLQTLYAPWNVEKICVNTRTAELIKYTNNALLAVQISAINEIANLAASVGGIDILDVVKGVHLDKRWNPVLSDGRRAMPLILTYLVPGCGFGGSCFPKDVQALRSHGEKYGLAMHMLNAVLDINDAQPNEVLNIVEYDLSTLEGKRVLVLGLAFKPGTDDVRESPSLKIIQGLLLKGAIVFASDPIAVENFKEAMGRRANEVNFVDDWIDCVNQVDVVIVATKWPEYKQLSKIDFNEKVFFDARRMFNPDELKGAIYRSIGRRDLSNL